MIRTLVYVKTVVFSTLFFSLVAVIGGLAGARRELYDWVHRSWARVVLAAAGVRVEATGLEHLRPGGAHLLVANHQSLFDIWAMMASLPVSLRFVAKEELSRIPVFGRACRAAGHVFIDRSDRAQGVRAVQEATARMRREGLSLVFFPEGTRSPDGRLGRFKRGPFSLAMATGLPLVPVAVEGGLDVLPKGEWRPSAGRIRLRCAAPVSLAGRGAGDRDAVLEETRAAIEEMLEALRTEETPRTEGLP